MGIKTIYICDSCCKENIGSDESQVEVVVGRQHDIASGRAEDVTATGHLCEACRRRFFSQLDALAKERRCIAKSHGLRVLGLPISVISSRGY